MTKAIDLTGQKFGRLLALESTNKRSGNNIVWKFLCDCGNNHYASTGNIYPKGKIQSCGCLLDEVRHRRKDLFNKRFGRLLVLGISEFGKWICECDCGNITEVATYNLTSNTRNKIRSCGCLHVEVSRENGKSRRLKEGESAFNSLFSRYKHNAKTRDLNFELSKEEFRTLTGGSCYYCGDVRTQKHAGKDLYGDYYYIGIDRKDNNKGYTLDNCVPCCWKCNQPKKAMSEEEFLGWIEKVYRYSFKRNLILQNIVFNNADMSDIYVSE